jgi:hypothetical protein
VAGGPGFSVVTLLIGLAMPLVLPPAVPGGLVAYASRMAENDEDVKG